MRVHPETKILVRARGCRPYTELVLCKCASQRSQYLWSLAGVRRQRVELLLPQAGGADSEAAGWPGGIRQQFTVARGLVEETLRQLKRADGLQARAPNSDIIGTHPC